MQEEKQPAVEHTNGLAKLLIGKVATHPFFGDTTISRMLLLLTFLLPIFFLPGTVIAPEFSKMLLLETIVFVSIIVWVVSRYRDGHMVIPKSSLLLVSFLLVIQFIVAGVFSPTPLLSFVGSGYDIGTVNAFVVLFLLLYLVSVIFTDRDRILTFLATLVGSTALVMVYHLARHFLGADFLDFGVFTSPTSSPVGKWNDMVALFGGVGLLMLSTLYFFPKNSSIKLPAYLILLVTIFFLLIVDFTILWIAIAISVALLIAFSVFDGERTHKLLEKQAHEEGRAHVRHPFQKRLVGHLPVVAVLFFLVALLYSSGLTGMTWGEPPKTVSLVVSNALKATPYSEIMLTKESTFGLLKGALSDSLLLGSGPNRFSSTFHKYKSTEINKTPYWDTTFDYGLGRIPTYFGTTGLIGMILWLAFIVLLFAKVRHVFALFTKDRIASFLAFTLFLLVLYFWTLAFFYLPNITIFALAFIFTGILIAFFVHEGVLGAFRVSLRRADASFSVMTPLVAVLLLGLLASGFLIVRQLESLLAFRDSEIAQAQGDLLGAEAHIKRAIAFSERDLYYRTLSNLSLAKLQRLTLEDPATPDIGVRANAHVTAAKEAAERAVALDSTNFENFLQLGGVYDALGALGVSNTAEPARRNYTEALALNPKSPRILFILGRVELLSGDRAKAKEYFHRALVERPNFLESIAILVQLEIEDGNTDIAYKILQNGIVGEPTNFLLHFALGYLHYNSGNYEEALRSLEFAVYLNPVYADAKYFLGLTYARLNQNDKALGQFEDVERLNPENKDIANIVRTLKAGRNLFRTNFVQPPVDSVTEALNNRTSE